MATNDDTNGCGETADYASACCESCDWQEDGDPASVIDAAEQHADEKQHHVMVDCTMTVHVEPD